jgi:ABC-2 type transport system permease protein
MSFADGLRDELDRLRRSRLDLALLTIVPAILLALMAAMISAGSPMGINVVVVDRDGGPLARAIIRNVQATPRLKLARTTAQIGPALSALRSEDASAVLVIPHEVGTAQAVQPLEIFYDAQFLSIGTLSSSYLQLAAGSALLDSGTDAAQRAAQTMVLRAAPGLHVRLLGNPTLSLGWYLGLLLGPGVLHLVIAISAIGSAAKLLDGKSFGAFARGTPNPSLRLIARMTPHIMAGTLWAIVWFLWLMLAHGYRMEGRLMFVVAGLLELFIATAALGLCLLAITRSGTEAMSGAVIVAGSALAYSGASLPISGAPWPAQAWNAVLPLTHYLRLQMDEVMGATWPPILRETGVLLLYPLLLGTLALWLITRSRRRS